MRIEINAAGTASVIYKVSDGIASRQGGGISRSERAELDKDETQEFLRLLNKARYWKLPREVRRIGLDGYDVVVEGVNDGVYHIVERWMPRKYDPVKRIEDYFFALIEQKFPE
ncbi:MAG: hypothetical protein FWG40_12850 [Peptococcaceae bacterium]|nr:hypothetical protein [Peptococcaceae bacterium]